MQCNKCNSDNTQRLEVIFQDGTQNINTKSTTIGGFGSRSLGIGGATTSTRGTSTTILAQKASPPRKASLGLPILAIISGFIFLGNSLPIWGILMLGVGFYFGYKAIQFNSNKWPKLHQHWQDSWMCHKCGNIYHCP
jgi:hypothetical protein